MLKAIFRLKLKFTLHGCYLLHVCKYSEQVTVRDIVLGICTLTTFLVVTIRIHRQKQLYLLDRLCLLTCTCLGLIVQALVMYFLIVQLN